MKKSRVTAEQIVGIFTEAMMHESPLAEICRGYGITEQTYYRLRRAYRGLHVNEATRLRALEGGHRRLNKLVADQVLDLAMRNDVAERK